MRSLLALFCVLRAYKLVICRGLFVTCWCLGTATIRGDPELPSSGPDTMASSEQESESTQVVAKLKTADALYDYIHQQATAKDSPSDDTNASDEDRLVAALAMRESRFDRLRPAVDAFLQRYPQDPRRWDVQLLRIGMHSLLHEQTNVPPEEAARIRRAIVAAPDAPASARHLARADLLQADLRDADANKGLTAALEAEMASYAADYPDDPMGGQIVDAQLRLLQATNPGRINGALEKLARSPNPSVANAAHARLSLCNERLDWKFRNAVDGQEIDLSQLRGKVVVLDFWATWCVPCVAKLPEILKLNEKYRDKDFQLIGISLDEDPKKMLGTAKAKGMDWPECCDGGGWKSDICTRLGVSAIPRTWLVDKRGFTHPLEATDDLDAAVAKFLAE